jgi:hypothetical protein
MSNHLAQAKIGPAGKDFRGGGDHERTKVAAILAFTNRRDSKSSARDRFFLGHHSQNLGGPRRLWAAKLCCAFGSGPLFSVSGSFYRRLSPLAANK